MHNLKIVNHKIELMLLYNKYYFYLIIKEDFLLAKNIEKKILFFYKKKKYDIFIKIEINSIIDYQKIYFEYQQENLFSYKKILLIYIKEDYIEHHILDMLYKTYQYNDKNIILIIQFTNLNYKNNIDYIKQKLQKYNIVIINCHFLSNRETRNWIIKKMKKFHLHLTLQSINLLLHNYACNLLKLYNILKILNIINIHNKKITLQCVKNIIEDSVMFNIKNWIDSLFLKDTGRSLRILHFFQKNKYNISHIIQYLKINLIYLIHKKENNIYNNYFNQLEKQCIIKYDNITLTNILKNINYSKLYKIIKILYHIEINIKKNNIFFHWEYLKIIVFIF
ncbi:hypothetical protein [Buchnera aphidicola]|uniref:hypothetical protein n=1 Tax=Buchnera aphidicola TaxID=9 RepID=UPI00346419FF